MSRRPAKPLVPRPAHLRISPRLASGERRLATSHGLPREVKRALMLAAYAKGVSLGRMLEDTLLTYYQLPTPRYKEPR